METGSFYSSRGQAPEAGGIGSKMVLREDWLLLGGYG
jgi:hypothetical protein